MSDLIATIRDLREKIVAGVFVNEAQVSMGVVARLLRALGWSDGPESVSPEHPIGTRRVDYALMRPSFGGVVLIEVKRVGKLKAKGEDQLFGYCAKQGVPLAVLTDGQEWRFYYPGGTGTYEQRRFATVDLVDDDAEACARRLARYLEYRVVASGEFEANVFGDYRVHQNQIAVRKEFPGVLETLVDKADSRFVALFCDDVESRCRIRPDEEAVREFLMESGTDHPPPDPPPKNGRGDGDFESDSDGDGEYWFDLRGVIYRFGSRGQLFVGLFQVLAERDPNFLQRAAVEIGGDVRPYLDRERCKVMKGRRWRLPPAQLPGGWWLRRQFNRDSMGRIVPRAANAAGLVLGRDLIVNLG